MLFISLPERINLNVHSSWLQPYFLNGLGCGQLSPYHTIVLIGLLGQNSIHNLRPRASRCSVACCETWRLGGSQAWVKDCSQQIKKKKSIFIMILRRYLKKSFTHGNKLHAYNKIGIMDILRYHFDNICLSNILFIDPHTISVCTPIFHCDNHGLDWLITALSSLSYIIAAGTSWCPCVHTSCWYGICYMMVILVCMKYFFI